MGAKESDKASIYYGCDMTTTGSTPWGTVRQVTIMANADLKKPTLRELIDSRNSPRRCSVRRSLAEMTLLDEKQKTLTPAMILATSGKDDMRKMTSFPYRFWVALNKQQLLTVMAAVVIGISVGAYLRRTKTDEKTLEYLRIPGQVVLDTLNVIIIPFFITALIHGITTFDLGKSASIAITNIVYCILTTFLAALIGLGVVQALRPGDPQRKYNVVPDDERLEPPDNFLNLIRHMFPPNIIEACFMKAVSSYEPKIMKQPPTTNDAPDNDWIHSLEYVKGTNTLGLTVFSVALGIATHVLEDRGEPLKLAVVSFNDAASLLVGYIVWLIPLGIIFLMADYVARMVDPWHEFLIHGYYMFTVLLALFIHGFLVLPLIYLVIVRKNPFKFMKHFHQAVRLALATSSSAETLPMTMKNLQDNKIDHRVLSYVVPVGATVNMHGLAIYVTVTTIFYGQANNLPLDTVHFFNLCLMAVVASVGSAGIPRSGIIALILVFQTVEYKVGQVGLIFIADWILDRFCTVLNVLGDAFGAGVVEKLSQKEIDRMAAFPSKRNLGDDNDPVMMRIKEILMKRDFSFTEHASKRGISEQTAQAHTHTQSFFEKSQLFFSELLSTDNTLDDARSSTSV